MPCLQNNWPSRMLVNRSVLIPSTFFQVMSTATNYMLCLEGLKAVFVLIAVSIVTQKRQNVLQ